MQLFFWWFLALGFFGFLRWVCGSCFVFLIFCSLAGSRPGRRHPFLPAQERMQRRRAAQLWHRRTRYAPVALRSDNCGKSDGMRLGCSCGCALTDTLLWNGWLACCAASLLVLESNIRKNLKKQPEAKCYFFNSCYRLIFRGFFLIFPWCSSLACGSCFLI